MAHIADEKAWRPYFRSATHVYSVMSGPCGEVRSFDEYQYFLSILGSGLGGQQVSHDQDEMYSNWWAIELAVFDETVERETGDLVSVQATFDTRGATHGSEYTVVSVRPAA